jgi:hypothetical protein
VDISQLTSRANVPEITAGIDFESGAARLNCSRERISTLSDATAFQPIDLRTARLLASPGSKHAAKRGNFCAACNSLADAAY